MNQRKLDFDNTKGIKSEDILYIKNKTGFELPLNIELFLKSYSGGNSYSRELYYTYECFHDDGYKTENSIVSIFTPEEIVEAYDNLKLYLEETFEHFELSTDYVETKYLLPIIELGNGGTINIHIGGKHNGKVYEVDNGDFGIILLSNSLQDFIEKLYVYDMENDKYIR